MAEARRRYPTLDIVAIGGNHDSEAHLDAPKELLKTIKLTVVGALPRRADGAVATERVVVPLHDRDGQVKA